MMAWTPSLFPEMESKEPKGSYSGYDRGVVVSAWIKEMRLGNVEATFYWLAVMLEANESRDFLARRCAIFAVEDVFDLSTAGHIASMAWAVNRRQMDDNAVWQMTYWLCKAPKFFQGERLTWAPVSGEEYERLSWNAIDAVKRGEQRPIPSYAVDLHTRQGRELRQAGQPVDERYSGTRLGRTFMIEQYRRLGKLDPAEPGWPGPGAAGKVEETEPGVFTVESFTSPGTFYRVDRRAGTCTCPAFQKGQKPCKHLRHVARDLMGGAVGGTEG